MTDRTIQIHCDKQHREPLEKIAKDNKAIGYWYNETSKNWIHYHVMIETYQTQDMLDAVQKHFDDDSDFHLMILPVEAYLPPPKAADDEKEAKEKERRQANASILREELENDMTKNATLDRNYVLMVTFSTLVASIGMIEDNVAVIVGAMVIAPFLGPNLALTFASAMGNKVLAWRAARCLLIGSAVALLCGLATGQFWPIDEIPQELAMRAQVDYSAIVLALAAGAAAVLSLTKGISSALVGVMVAAALVPPLAAAGVFFGHGHFTEGLAAMVLLAVNIVCINLSGLGVFIVRGIGPRTWYEKREAKKSVYIYAGVWGGALLALIAGITGMNLLGN